MLSWSKHRSKGHVEYAGIETQVNHGCIQEFLETGFDKDQTTYDLMIVELEARASTALVSARKYLPESSQDLTKSFGRYLTRVVERCRATADPRAEAIGQLREALRLSGFGSTAYVRFFWFCSASGGGGQEDIYLESPQPVEKSRFVRRKPRKSKKNPRKFQGNSKENKNIAQLLNCAKAVLCKVERTAAYRMLPVCPSE